MRPRPRLSTLALLVVAACGDTAPGTGDANPTVDAATPDVAVAPDATDNSDATVLPDLTATSDLIATNDLTTTNDLTITNDLIATNDLITTNDLVAKDLVVLPDLTSPADAGPPLILNAFLTGHQEAPQTAVSNTASAVITVDSAKTTIQVTLTNPTLANPTAAHLHLGRPGRNGPVIFTLSNGTFLSPLKKTLTAADFTKGNGLNTFADAVAALLGGEMYVNIHTMANPGGAIRGHVGPIQMPVILSGGQEPTASTARGTATVSINATQDQIDVALDVGTLKATAAHIHAGRSGRDGGPIVLPIAGAFTGKYSQTLKAGNLSPGGGVNTFEDAVDALLSGLAYVNVHTTMYPAGEIRGQVGAVELHSVVAGSQEAPAKVSTPATGEAITVLDADHTHVNLTLEFGMLSGAPTAAHYHVGALGAAGPVILPLGGAGFMAPLTKEVGVTDLMKSIPDGIQTFDDAVEALLSGRIYVNVHTMAHPGGEIRGQVGPVSMKATLDGASEVPKVTTIGKGSSTLRLDGLQQQIVLALLYTDVHNITAAHVHVGPPAMSGPVIFPLATMTFASPLVKTLTAADFTKNGGLNTFNDAVNAILSQDTYANIHTQANPTGEIRGQIVP